VQHRQQQAAASQGVALQPIWHLIGQPCASVRDAAVLQKRSKFESKPQILMRPVRKLQQPQKYFLQVHVYLPCCSGSIAERTCQSFVKGVSDEAACLRGPRKRGYVTMYGFDTCLHALRRSCLHTGCLQSASKHCTWSRQQNEAAGVRTSVHKSVCRVVLQLLRNI
jgi:hypothetical protein